MAWIEPKTDWKAVYENGQYVGDYFNATDFNRIKNNIEYLHEQANKLYQEFEIGNLPDKTVEDFLYADELNTLEANLNELNNRTVKQDYGTSPTYYTNGRTIDYTELNRIESSLKEIYELLYNQYNGRRMLTLNLGITEEF
jgi:hypothetical protein